MKTKFTNSIEQAWGPFLLFLTLNVMGVNVCNGAVELVLDAQYPGGNGKSNGIDDNFLIVRKDDLVEFRINGKLSKQFRYDAISTLTIEGSNDDDQLIVSFEHGNPIPPGGLFYHGNANANTGDTLVLQHGLFKSVSHTYHNDTDGVIHLDGSAVVYTGLEPVIDITPSANLTVNGTHAGNAITYSQSPVNSNGLVSIDNFETIEFANKTQLTINGQNGSDDIVINYADTPPGLAKIVVNGGNGDDNIVLAVDSPVDVEINAQSGDDVIRAKLSTTADIQVDGGDHNVGDVLIAGPVNEVRRVDVETDTVEIEGFESLHFIDVERVVGLDRKARRNLLKERTPW
ncbi:MAG: hypothetical protein ACU833_14585 [Gammaproteobacteria bacterium]